MAWTSHLRDATSNPDDLALPAGEATISMDDAADILGIPVDGVVALVEAGLLGEAVMRLRLPLRRVEDFAERLWRSALPTASDARGAGLVEAVNNLGCGPAIWPVVVTALLKGRINAFRCRGHFAGPILSALVVSSGRVVSDLVSSESPSTGTPFIWAPSEPD
jgi:hypothetical protein